MYQITWLWTGFAFHFSSKNSFQKNKLLLMSYWYCKYWIYTHPQISKFTIGKTLNWISSMSLLLLWNLYIMYIPYPKNRINIYTYASFFEIYSRYILIQFNKILELKVLYMYHHKCLRWLPPLTKKCWRYSNEVSVEIDFCF